MTVDRSLYAHSFDAFPAWVCPTCNKGHLTAEKNGILDKETGPSKDYHPDPGWDVDWVERRFSALMECNYANCGELVAILGSVSVSEEFAFDHEGEPGREYVEWYKPKALFPAPLPIMPIPGTPEDVDKGLREAAALLWQSPEAAANQIRQAVEHLMDALKVRKQVLKNGKKTRVTLHQRIEWFKERDADSALVLLAIKWLGNSGSHSGGLKREDVLDAFDMIELVLANLYATERDTIMKKARAINKLRGPSK